MLRAIPTAVSAAQRFLSQSTVAPGLSPVEKDHFDRVQTRKMVDCLINVLSPLTRSTGGTIEDRVHTLFAVLTSQSAACKRSEGLELEKLRCLANKTVDKEGRVKIGNLAQVHQEKLREIAEEERIQPQMFDQILRALQDAARQAVRA